MSDLFKVACSRCHMEFKNVTDLEEHQRKEKHSTAHDAVEAKYIQTVFTPKDIEVIDVLTAMGLAVYRQVHGDATPIAALALGMAIQHYTSILENNPEQSRQALMRLSQIAHGVTKEQFNAISEALGRKDSNLS